MQAFEANSRQAIAEARMPSIARAIDRFSIIDSGPAANAGGLGRIERFLRLFALPRRLPANAAYFSVD
jgi:hypothetical protein